MPISVGESPLNDDQERTDCEVHNQSSNISQNNAKRRQKVHDPSRDLSIQVLEKFSLVTKFARDTTSQLFHENYGDGYGAIKGRSHNQSSLDCPQKASNTEDKAPDKIPVASDPLEVFLCSFIYSK